MDSTLQRLRAVCTATARLLLLNILIRDVMEVSSEINFVVVSIKVTVNGEHKITTSMSSLLTSGPPRVNYMYYVYSCVHDT